MLFFPNTLNVQTTRFLWSEVFISLCNFLSYCRDERMTKMMMMMIEDDVDNKMMIEDDVDDKNEESRRR